MLAIQKVTRRWPLRGSALAVAAVLASIASSVPALAAEPAGPTAEDGLPTGQAARPDFRFAAPTMSFGVRGGWMFNRSEGEIYDFLTEELTLERSDFDAPMIAVDFSWRLSSRVDAVLGAEYSTRSKRSEFRDYVDENDLPIVQDTRITQVPVTVSLKFYLADRGRSVGQYAWVPATIVPYVGGGGGATWYRLEQEGDFVDAIDLAIFVDKFVSDGWTVAAHAFAGVDIRINPSLGLVIEGRYQWASPDLRGEFVGFDPLDLNGIHATVGVNWRF